MSSSTPAKKATTPRAKVDPPPNIGTPAADQLPGTPTPPKQAGKPPVILNVAYKPVDFETLPKSDTPRTLFEDLRIFGTDKAAYAFARSPEGRGWSFVDVEKGASIAEAVKADLA